MHDFWRFLHLAKPKRRTDVLISAIAMTIGLLGANAATQAGWTEVRAVQNGHFVVKAHINGVGVPAVIDTGASVVVIPWRLARRMGLKPAFLKFNQVVLTANGRAKAARVMLRQVTVNGTVTVRNVRALVAPRGALRHVLIGMSYLGQLRRYSVRGNRMRLVN